MKIMMKMELGSDLIHVILRSIPSKFYLSERLSIFGDVCTPISATAGRGFVAGCARVPQRPRALQDQRRLSSLAGGARPTARPPAQW